jgi:putative inorganic carbon (hco3(-)) transporter
LFALFVLLNAVLFIRPSELIPDLMDLPIYEALILLCLLLALPLVARRVAPDSLVRMPITAGVLLVWVSIVLSHLSHFQIYGARTEGTQFLKVVLYYLLLVSVVDTPERLRRFIAWLSLFTAALTTLAVLQYHGWINIPGLEPVREILDDVDPETGTYAVLLRLVASGIFNDPNDLCMILILGGIFCIYLSGDRSLGSRRFLWLIPVPLFGYALALTHSRGGFLAMLASVVALLASRVGVRKTVLASAVGLPLLFIVFAGRQTSISTSDGTGQHRIQLWSEAFAMLAGRSIVFGIGKGQIAEELGYVAHNSFVQSYIELGVVGGAVFLGLFVFACVNLFRLGSSGVSIQNEQIRRLRPYLLAVLAGFGVGLLSLSRNYSLTTYLVLGLLAVFFRLADPRGALPWLRLRLKMGPQLAALSVLFLFGAYVFIRVSLNWSAQ